MMMLAQANDAGTTSERASGRCHWHNAFSELLFLGRVFESTDLSTGVV